MRIYDGMLIGTSDGSGRLMRVFSPPWYRIDRWAGWYVAILLEAADRQWRRLLKRPPTPAILRGRVTIAGLEVRAIDDGGIVRLANVPRKR